MRVGTFADVLLAKNVSALMKDTARAYERLDPCIAAIELEQLAEVFRRRSLKLEKVEVTMPTTYERFGL